MGDFTGFKFGGVSSSSLGIIRVSSGDRYEEQLHPEIKDITAEVPGLDGEYYFGSTYGTKTIDLEIAFDHITEEQFKEIRRVFSSRKPQDLIFDERPYKKYLAKIDSPVELSYVCFDEPKRHLSSTTTNGVRRDRENDQEYVPGGEVTDNINVSAGETVTYTLTHIPSGEVTISPDTGYTHEEGTYTYVFSNSGTDEVTFILTYTYDAIPFEAAWEQVTPWIYDEGTQRIYKGEGKITFVCRFPFAKSVFKQLPEGSEEWAISSGILSAEDYAAFDTYSSGSINIYNAGDIDAGFRLYLPAAVITAGTTLTYKVDGTATTAQLVLKPMTIDSNDVGVLIDTVNELIIGVTNATTLTTSNRIYNQCVDAGYFFKFEPNISKNDGSVLEITNGASGITIDYDYLYF